MFTVSMSSLRVCGALARKPLLSPSKNVQLTVPIVFKIRDVANTYARYQQYREFKNFGHKPTPIPTSTKLFHLFIGTGFLLCLLDWKR